MMEKLGASRFDKPTPLLPANIVFERTEYPDSWEFGTPKHGKIKVYYNADNLVQSKLRIANSLAVKLFGVKLFADEAMTEKSADQFIQDILEEIKNAK